jgi:hypothetical protein
MLGEKLGQSIPNFLFLRRFAGMARRESDNQCMIGIVVNRIRSHVEATLICRYLADVANVQGDSLPVRPESAKSCQRTVANYAD